MPLRTRPRACAALLLCLQSLHGLPCRAAPRVETEHVVGYRVEARAPGDGAPIVQVPDGVPEPLFLSASRERLTVWWRVRHRCGETPRPRATVRQRRLTLAADPALARETASRCEEAGSLLHATVFETSVAQPSVGAWQLVGAGAAATRSFWLRVPATPRPKELPVLAERLREREALRVLGEHIAWRYYEQREAKATLAAYRWLVSLDELHWRTPLYRARIFESLAFTRSKGSAIAAVDTLIPAVLRLRSEVSAQTRKPAERGLGEAPPDATASQTTRHEEMKRELAGLEVFLERSLRWLALRWHSESAYRWQAASSAYAAYLQLYPDAKHAPLARFFYASALLRMDDALAAREQFRLAAAGLPDAERRDLAAACALLLGVEGGTRAELAVCRSQKPDRPSFDDFPTVEDAAFARPRTSATKEATGRKPHMKKE